MFEPKAVEWNDTWAIMAATKKPKKVRPGKKEKSTTPRKEKKKPKKKKAL
jgi:hypothetical protein